MISGGMEVNEFTKIRLIKEAIISKLIIRYFSFKLLWKKTWKYFKTVKQPSFIYIWGNILKNGLSRIYGRQLLKNLKWYGLFKQTISLQIFKGCLPQILLGRFLNTLSHLLHTYVYILEIKLSMDFIEFKKVVPMKLNSLIW